MGLFGLKIGWDVARAFLTEAALIVLPLDLLYSGGDGNHEVGGHFRHFSIFSSLTALMIHKICLNDCQGLIPSLLSTNRFILAYV
jgi:hypothetical protein